MRNVLVNTATTAPKKIMKLTPEQEARFPEFVERYINLGLCCEPACSTTARRCA